MKKNNLYAKILILVVFVLSNIGIGLMPIKVSAIDDGQTLSVNVQKVISLTVNDATVPLGDLTPGTAIYSNTSAEVSTNSDNGGNLSIKRDDTNTTMDLATDPNVDFPDATTGDPAANSGNGNASLTPGANLSFRVRTTGTTADLYNSAWGGTTDTEVTGAKYAGLGGTSTVIATRSTYSAVAQDVNYRYRADSPITQKNGSYEGTVTITALVNP